MAFLYDPERARFRTSEAAEETPLVVPKETFWILAVSLTMVFAVVGGQWWGRDYWLQTTGLAQRLSLAAGLELGLP